MHKSVANGSINQDESAFETNVNKRGRPTRIFIPNVLARWPWPRRINPNYAVLKEEASTWITSFQAFGPKAQDAYNRCDIGKPCPSCSVRILICLIDLLACLIYPVARKGRVTADTLIKVFTQSFIQQSMLELVVI